MRYLLTLCLILSACIKIGREIPQNAEKGGTIAIGIPQDFESLIPIYPSFRASNAIFDLIYYPLIRIEKDKVYPGIASEWEYSEDLRTITFYLRKDAKWHDGKPVTARDFVFTYELITAPNSTSPLKANFRFVKEIKAVSDNVLRIEFTKSYSSQLIDCEIYPLPEHILKDVKYIKNSEFAKKPIGCGPYKVKEYVRGDRLILSKFEDFFENTGFADEIIFKIYETPMDVAQALKMDLIDIALGLTPRAVSEVLKDYDKGKVKNYEANKVIFFGWNLRKSPFNNFKLRRAIGLLLDPDKWIKEIFSSYAVKANSPIPPNLWAYDSTLKEIPFNKPDEGINIISSLGYTKRKPLVINLLCDNSQEVYVKLANSIKEELENSKIIKVNVLALSPFDFITRLLNSDFDAFLLAYPLNEKADISPLFGSKGIFNFMGYSNKRVDSLLESAMMTLNRKKAKKYFSEFQKIIQSELPIHSLIVPQEIYAFSERLKNLENFTGDFLVSNLDLVWIPSSQRTERVSFEIVKEEEKKEEIKPPEARPKRERKERLKRPVEPKPAPPPAPKVTAEELLQKKIAEEAAKKKEEKAVEEKPKEEVKPEEVAKAPEEKVTEKPPEETPPASPQAVIPAVLPVIKKEVRPQYPEIAKKFNAHGTVYMRVLIDENGKVKSVKIVKSSGYNFLDNAAKEAAFKYEFEPAKDKDGKPVATWFPLAIRF